MKEIILLHMKTVKPLNSGYIWSKLRLQTKFTFGGSLNVIWMKEMTGQLSSMVFLAVKIKNQAISPVQMGWKNGNYKNSQ
jgi:hypothetical protein